MKEQGASSAGTEWRQVAWRGWGRTAGSRPCAAVCQDQGGVGRYGLNRPRVAATGPQPRHNLPAAGRMSGIPRWTVASRAARMASSLAWIPCSRGIWSGSIRSSGHLPQAFSCAQGVPWSRSHVPRATFRGSKWADPLNATGSSRSATISRPAPSKLNAKDGSVKSRDSKSATAVSRTSSPSSKPRSNDDTQQRLNSVCPRSASSPEGPLPMGSNFREGTAREPSTGLRWHRPCATSTAV